MDCPFIIISLLLQLIVITISFTLFIYLYKRKDIFPYANISPMWSMTFLICICIREMFQMSVLILRELNEHFWCINYIDLLSTMFIHYVLIWPILGRLYYISKCMEFNFSFLTKKIYPNYLLYDNDLDIKNQMYTEKRSTYLSKIIFFPLFGFFILFVIMSLIEYTRCYLFAFNSLNQSLKNECVDIVSNTEYRILSLAKLFVDFTQIILLTQFLFNVLIYPLKADQFKLRFELCFLYTIWFLFHHVQHTLIIYEFISYCPKRNLFVNLIEDLFYVCFYIYLITIRNKINVNQFYSMFHDFEIFMSNPICFNYLKHYIKNTHEEEYYSLFTFIDLTYYKKHFNKNSYENNVENANLIYEEYFTVHDKFNRDTRITYNRTRSYSYSSGGPISIHKINCMDFPLDIVEKLEDSAKEEFKIPQNQLHEVFDEALAYVSNKLFNRYLMMIRNKEEYKKLEKLICYFDFDFSNCKSDDNSDDNLKK